MRHFVTRSEHPELNPLTAPLSCMDTYRERLSTDTHSCLVDIDTGRTLGWFPTAALLGG